MLRKAGSALGGLTVNALIPSDSEGTSFLLPGLLCFRVPKFRCAIGHQMSKSAEVRWSFRANSVQ
jgi:hypothetical protein